VSQPAIGSVCTGYGGLDLAVAAVLGARQGWVADPDPGAARILAHRWPTVPNLGDITAVDWSDVPPVDVLTAGFPCQDLSYAGRGAGIKEGTRSGLWFTVAHALGVLRPRLAFFENVAAITARRPGLDVVAADLAALGFDAEWTCLRASDVGAPHRRERWFCLAWPSYGGGAAADTDDLGGHRDRARRPGRDEPAAQDLPATHPRATRGGLGDGDRRVAAHPPRLGSGEPADPPHTVAGSGQTRPEPRRRSGGAPADAPGDGRHQRRPQPERQRRGPDAPLRSTADWGAYGPAVTRWEAALGRPASRPTDDRGRLDPRFVEWLMGLPDGWVTDVPGLTRNQQLHALGNGVVPAQAIAALHTLLPAYHSSEEAA
jgi:DNA (cytosine-5)-methyltransferase 1